MDDSTNSSQSTPDAAKRDCIDECAKAYDKCMEKAGSDAEKLACKAAYDKCISNC